MTSSNQFDLFIPVYDAVPEKWEDARDFLVEHFKKISNVANARVSGFFIDTEVLAGKSFIPSSGVTTGESPQFRTVLRKVVNTGTLPNTGTKQIAHGITVDANFTLIQLYGAASDPTGLHYFPLPWVEVKVPAAGGIQLEINGANIEITTAADRTNFTRSFVVIEYIQEI